MKGPRRNSFRLLVGLCGLTLPEAAELTGQQPQTAKMKNLGRRRTTEDDIRILFETWMRIRAGDVEGLPDGAVRMAQALVLATDIENGTLTPTSLVEEQFGTAS